MCTTAAHSWQCMPNTTEPDDTSIYDRHPPRTGGSLDTMYPMVPHSSQSVAHCGRPKYGARKLLQDLTDHGQVPHWCVHVLLKVRHRGGGIWAVLTALGFCLYW